MTSSSKTLGDLWPLEIPGKILVYGNPKPLPSIGGFPTAVDNFLETWKHILNAMNISMLTPLQKRIIFSLIPDGMDLYIVGPKCSGKRTAYFLPMLEYVVDQLGRGKWIDQARIASPASIIFCDCTTKALQLKERLDDILSNIPITSTSGNPVSTGCPTVVIIDNIHDLSPDLRKQPLDILIVTGSSLLELVSRGIKHMTNLLPIRFNRAKYIIFEEYGMEQYFWDHDVILFIKFISRGKANRDLVLPIQAHLIFSGSIWRHQSIRNIREALCDLGRESCIIFGSALHSLQFSSNIRWTVKDVEHKEGKLKEVLDICQQMISEHRKVAVACGTTDDTFGVSDYLLKEGRIVSKVITCADEDSPHVSGVFGKYRDSTLANVYVIADNAWDHCTFYDATCLIHFDLGEERRIGSGKRRADQIPFQHKRFSSIWNCMTRGQLTEGDKRQPGLTYFMLSGDEPNFLAFYQFVRTLGGDGVRLPSTLQKVGKQNLITERLKRPFCVNFKCFAFCAKMNCPDRHEFTQADLDTAPDAPTNGELEIKVIQSISPSLYVAKLQKHYVFNEEKKRVCVHDYQIEARTRILHMMEFFAIEKNRIAVNPSELVVDERLYGCPIERKRTRDSTERKIKVTMYLRGRITGMHSIANSDDGGYTDYAEMYCVDSGNVLNIPVAQLLVLPEEFEKWKHHCVQVVLSNLSCLEHTTEYHCTALTAARELTEGKVWLSKVLLSIRDTVWVNPMVQFDTDPVTGTLDFGCNVAVELCARGCVWIHDLHHHMAIILEHIRKQDKDYPEIEHETNSTVPLDEEDEEFAEGAYQKYGDAICWAQLPISKLTSAEGNVSELKLLPFKIYCMVTPWEIHGAIQNTSAGEDFDTVYQIEEKLTKETEHILANKEGHFEKLSALLQPGSVVAVHAAENGKWRRGMISYLYRQDGEVYDRAAVACVDYGSILSDLVLFKQVVPIRKIYVEELPFQAVSISLAHTKPMNGSNEWGVNELELFSAMIHCDNQVNVVAFHKLSKRGYYPWNTYQAMAYQQLLEGDGADGYPFEDIGVQLIQNKGAQITKHFWNDLLSCVKVHMAGIEGREPDYGNVKEHENTDSTLMSFQTLDVSENEFIAVAENDDCTDYGMNLFPTMAGVLDCTKAVLEDDDEDALCPPEETEKSSLKNSDDKDDNTL